MEHRTANISTSNRKFPIWFTVLFAMLAIALLGHLGFLELSGEEPRRAVVAWEMIDSGDYIVPRAYGMDYYNKPPMYHWLLASSMKIIGTGEWAVRLPGILGFLGMALGIFLWLSGFMSRAKALLPALLFLTSADLLYYGTVFPAEIDLVFSLLLFIQAIGIFMMGKNPDKFSGYLTAYVFLVFAIWTKGWLAVHFHLFTVLAWFVFLRRFRRLFNFKHLFAILAAGILVAVYFYLYSTKGNLTYLLLNNFIESGSKIVEVNIWSLLNQATETPLALFKIALPWSLLLILFYNKSLRQFIWKNKVYAFSAIYVLSNIWLYWFFIDVRDRYLYPFIPFVCILIYAVIEYQKWWPQKKSVFLTLMTIMLSVRILYNVFVMPGLNNGKLSDDYIYRELTDTLLQYSHDEPIDLLTPKKSEPLPFEYKGIDRIPKQPWIPYQLPYYIMRKSGHTMKVVDRPVPGKYYLILEGQKDILSESDSLYGFKEAWFGKPMVLIQAK